ncbi:PREDICTED: protein Njmu-R1-like [Amphimedon queenslandica]|uniref:Uncharacterized protein n=1 Tax=Amphimedon queenslandica TaxID=400682 RepID=A0AAN0JF23_AMPQE|nr:PREDICTED: protein Njmu-R1-like [Amphimedon queenslandica]|eukprot:XP_019855635.1 PREDICTED: protein Njmu-R1-like [Amphimedon queenslandica]
MADMNGAVTSGESDGGGLLGDIIDLEWTDGDFCLFCSSVVDGNSDTKLEECLQVVLSNLTGDGRDRLFSLLKDLNIKPWTLRPGCGVVSSFQTKSTNSGQLYTCLISPHKRPNSTSSPTKDTNKSKYLLCCLSLREKGLESFREDLDTFTGTLKPYLIKQNPDFSPDSELYQHIQSWTSTLYYLSRLIPKCHDQLPLLLHASLNSTVKVSGDNPETIQELKESTGNADLLLKCSLREAQSQNEKESKAVLDSLDEFMHRKNETVTKKTSATATGSTIDLI